MLPTSTAVLGGPIVAAGRAGRHSIELFASVKSVFSQFAQQGEHRPVAAWKRNEIDAVRIVWRHFGAALVEVERSTRGRRAGRRRSRTWPRLVPRRQTTKRADWSPISGITRMQVP